ncbi:MAG: hypothetical protein OXP09_12595 [Gammaproteobacteria bacterium]|nr:hypothetical protein [Gammaproteobacteria bacterium]
MNRPEQFLDDYDLRTEAIKFGDDPNEYFGRSEANMHTIPRERLASLHEEVLKYRFDSLVDKIPMLQQLAAKQGIERLDSIDDAVPLLFEHTMYKAYPPFLLEHSRFADINRFISKLTSIDISDVDVSDCKTIDEWLDVLDTETDLYLTLSSGTTGTMSFIPASRREWDKRFTQIASVVRDRTNEGDEDVYCIFPYFRRGGPMRVNDYFVKDVLDGDESRFIPAFPQRLSADVLYLTGRIRSAKAKGKLDSLQINPALLERVKEFEELQNNMPKLLGEFFTRTYEEFKGRRLFFAGTWSMLHTWARQGLEKGLEGVFAPNSYVQGGGGSKGVTPPENWQEDVCRFIGIDKLHMAYGMSEVFTLNYQCEYDRYHLSPVAIPFVLDPDTSKPLPRTGRQTGRAAFFDVGSETRWGGFITGDEITVNWSDYCPCGRQSHFIEGEIQRYSEKRGGDDKITCAATESAHNEAMDYLTSLETDG